MHVAAVRPHLLADVEAVCSQVVILYGGAVQRSGTVEDLLTLSDSVLLRTDPLGQELIEEIRSVLASHERRLHGVEAPVQRLETLFLEIVRQASDASAETSGAQSRGVTAPFLLERSVKE